MENAPSNQVIEFPGTPKGRLRCHRRSLWTGTFRAATARWSRFVKKEDFNGPNGNFTGEFWEVFDRILGADSAKGKSMAAVSSSISCFNQPLWKVTPARIDGLIKWDSLLKTWLSVFKIRHLWDCWSHWSPGVVGSKFEPVARSDYFATRVEPLSAGNVRLVLEKLRTGAGGHGRSSHC